jgi:large subunit ribosomal protein L10e
MAGLRKATAYSKKRVVPYTRFSKKRQKSYIKMLPPQKIVKFTMGKAGPKDMKKLKHRLDVVSDENIQIRHNALEACRQFINKKLETILAGNYMFKVVPYPHHVQRENKMLTGAGADRMQTGMQLAYGKPAGKAAILKKGAKIFQIAVADDKGVIIARKTIKQLKAKLPGKIKIFYELKK